jgi:tetratricopeptide (TPR) repeat protein
MLKFYRSIAQFFIKIILSGTIFIFLGFAPNNQTAVDSLLLEGHRYELKQEYKSAKKIYKKILKDESNNPDALMGLGRIAVAAEEWEPALNNFDKALAVGKHLLENHFYLGICFRETGKAKAWILQKLDFRQSEKHFKYVLDHDSLYQDVLYQYALLWRYRDNYEDAIQNCQAQIRLKPYLYTPQLELFRFYRYLITHRSPEDSYAWLKQDSWPMADYFWGEKLRREDRLANADSVLQELLECSSYSLVQPILLSLAKINYEQDRPELGEKQFWQAVQRIQRRLEADLIFEELKYIVTNKEYQDYKNLNAAEQFRDFFRNFWFVRNPIPSLNTNIRLTEHFRRMIISEKYYEYDGFRLWSDNPDKLLELQFPQTHYLNQEFNDRGLVLIRHGEPDERIATVESDLPTNESWLYYASNEFPQLTYHFILAKPDNDWRLTPRLDDWRMYEDRLDWGNIYYYLMQSGELEREGYRQELIDECQQSVTIGLSTDRHTWQQIPSPIQIALTAETYRGSMNQTILEMTQIIPLSELQENVKGNGSDRNLEQVLAIYEENSEQVYKKVDTLKYQMYKSEKYLMYLYQLQLEPNNYHIVFHIRTLDDRCLGCVRIERQLENYHEGGFKLSDIQVASFIEPSDLSSEFVKNGLLVIPNPAANFTRDKPIYLYFELYNIILNQAGNAFIIVDYTLTSIEEKKKKTLFNLFGLFGTPKTSSISIQNERNYSTDSAVEYLALDVSSIPSGSYTLSVRVTDASEGSTVVKSKVVYLK